MILKSGSIVSFNNEKKYGFIKQDDGAREVFFHISDAKDLSAFQLKPKLRVKYLLESALGKTRATNVMLEQNDKRVNHFLCVS